MEPRELTLAIRSGNLDEAVKTLEEQRTTALGRGDLSASAAAANDLGVVYYISGRLAPARQALENSRDDFVRLNDRLGQARALGNLARVEEKSRNRNQALSLYLIAADLFHEENAPSEEFATLRSLSQLYLKMGGWMQALATFDRGLTIKPGRSLLDSLLHWLYQIPLRMIGFSPT